MSAADGPREGRGEGPGGAAGGGGGLLNRFVQLPGRRRSAGEWRPVPGPAAEGEGVTEAPRPGAGCAEGCSQRREPGAALRRWRGEGGPRQPQGGVGVCVTSSWGGAGHGGQSRLVTTAPPGLSGPHGAGVLLPGAGPPSPRAAFAAPGPTLASVSPSPPWGQEPAAGVSGAPAAFRPGAVFPSLQNPSRSGSAAETPSSPRRGFAEWLRTFYFGDILKRVSFLLG